LPNFEELRHKWNKDGYLAIDQIVHPKELDKLRDQIYRLIDNVPESELTSIFSTGKAQEKTRDQYFLSSGDKIRFFLEEKAQIKDGKLITPKHLAINKVAHYLHELDPIFKKFTRTPINITIAKQVLGYTNPVLCQSMYIMKQPKIGGAVPVHQDSTYLHTTPETVCGMWFPIDDAYKSNSCLWVAPGSHKGPLRSRFILNATRDGVIHVPPLDTITDWPDDKEYIPVEVKRGAVVIFHGRLCHKSDENTSNNTRHAYIFHLVEESAKWANDNWLQIGKLPKFE